MLVQGSSDLVLSESCLIVKSYSYLTVGWGWGVVDALTSGTAVEEHEQICSRCWGLDFGCLLNKDPTGGSSELVRHPLTIASTIRRAMLCFKVFI